MLAGALPSLAAGAAAPRGDGDDVVRRGSCTGSTDWKIKAKPDDGRIEVEAEVDSNVNGQRWRWVLRHNGSVSAAGRARTDGPERLVQRRAPDGRRGRHRLLPVPRQQRRSGEVCVARVKL